MPIYEYHCPKCGDFETTQKITEPPLQKCPTCRRKVTKLISATSFQLKGSGWYVTDYGKGGSGASGKKSDAGSGADAKPASDAKASTKSAAKDTKAA